MYFDYVVKKHVSTKLTVKYCIHDSVKNYGIMSELTFQRFKTVLKLDKKRVLYVQSAKSSNLNSLSDI